jgi:hypothetical protein
MIPVVHPLQSFAGTTNIKMAYKTAVIEKNMYPVSFLGDLSINRNEMGYEIVSDIPSTIWLTKILRPRSETMITGPKYK